MDEGEPLVGGNHAGFGHYNDTARMEDLVKIFPAIAGQGLTLVHFSAQL